MLHALWFKPYVRLQQMSADGGCDKNQSMHMKLTVTHHTSSTEYLPYVLTSRSRGEGTDLLNNDHPTGFLPLLLASGATSGWELGG
jgi:hypothetical protein